MAPKQSKACKRQAPKKEPSAPAQPAKKQKLPNEVQAIYDVVAGADLPSACREMILAAIPSSFLAFAGERHDIQREIVSIVGDIVDSSGAEIRRRLQCAHSHIAEMNSATDQLHSRVAEAELNLCDGQRLLHDRQATLSSALVAVTEATDKMTEAEEALLEGIKLAALDEADLGVLNTAMQNTLPALTEGVGVLPSTEDVNAAVQPLLRLLDVDKSLVIALPSACAKEAGERGAFDKMVIDQFQATLKDKVAELSGKVNSGEKTVAELRSALDGAKQHVEDSTSGHAKATQEVEEASQALAIKDAALAHANDELIKHQPVLQVAARRLQECESELQNYECYTLECFQRRRDANNEAAPTTQEACGDEGDRKDAAKSQAADTVDPEEEIALESPANAKSVDDGVACTDPRSLICAGA